MRKFHAVQNRWGKVKMGNIGWIKGVMVLNPWFKLKKSYYSSYRIIVRDLLCSLVPFITWSLVIAHDYSLEIDLINPLLAMFANYTHVSHVAKGIRV